MPLNRQDCIELAKQVERLLREFDPAASELVFRSTERYNDPRRYFVELLRTIRHLYAERSGGMHGVILDRINQFVRLPDGSPVRGITVALTPAEMERYRTEEVNLAELPDRSDFLAELDRILSIVIHEIDFERDQG
ncbi:MAG: hypothetical protein IT159_11435 [Bryobacterales bacterium]|nr:hypothetical protein [Bryobacterales bacterium]